MELLDSLPLAPLTLSMLNMPLSQLLATAQLLPLSSQFVPRPTFQTEHLLESLDKTSTFLIPTFNNNRDSQCSSSRSQ